MVLLLSCKAAEKPKQPPIPDPDISIAESAQSDPWIVDLDQSSITFEALEKGNPVIGEFGRFNIQVDLDLENPSQGQIEAVIDLNSVDAGNADRNQVLRDSEMFHVRQSPIARFVSSKISRLPDKSYEAKGKLILKGLEHEIVLPFSVSQNDNRVAATAIFEMSRLDYRIGTGSFLSNKYVGYPVTVRIEVSARKADEQKSLQ